MYNMYTAYHDLNNSLIGKKDILYVVQRTGLRMIRGSLNTDSVILEGLLNGRVILN